MNELVLTVWLAGKLLAVWHAPRRYGDDECRAEMRAVQKRLPRKLKHPAGKRLVFEFECAETEVRLAM